MARRARGKRSIKCDPVLSAFPSLLCCLFPPHIAGRDRWLQHPRKRRVFAFLLCTTCILADRVRATAAMAGFVDHVASLREQIEEGANSIKAKIDVDVQDCLEFLRRHLMMVATPVTASAPGSSSSSSASKNTIVAAIVAPPAPVQAAVQTVTSEVSSADFEARADKKMMDEYGMNWAWLSEGPHERAVLARLCKRYKLKANGKTAEMQQRLLNKCKVRNLNVPACACACLLLPRLLLPDRLPRMIRFCCLLALALVAPACFATLCDKTHNTRSCCRR